MCLHNQAGKEYLNHISGFTPAAAMDKIVLVHKLSPLQGGQGEAQEKGRVLQIGRWQC